MFLLVAFVVIVASLSLLSSRHEVRQNTELTNRTKNGVDALDNNAVHVILASTDEMIPGVEASIRSVEAHASGPVTFHYIGDSPLRSMPNVKHYSLAEASQKYQLEDFVCLGDRGDGQNNINTMHANFARFILDELLPRTVKKAMYIDVDTVVFCDVNALIDSVLNDNIAGIGDTGPVIAAVPRNHIYGLTRRGEKKYGRISPSFNAGAYVVHLERWRDRKMGNYIRDIALTNNKKHWYYLGSQPPLNIAIGSHFEWLPVGWNVKAKRVKSGFKTKSGEEVCLVHWTGPVKPWQADDSSSVHLLDIWEQYDKQDSAATRRGKSEA